MRSAKSVLCKPNRRVVYTQPLKGLSHVGGNIHAWFLGGWRWQHLLATRRKFLEETCLSVGSFLPEHAIVATRWYGASETMYPR